jgi:hypothetical protein
MNLPGKLFYSLLVLALALGGSSRSEAQIAGGGTGDTWHIWFEYDVQATGTYPDFDVNGNLVQKPWAYQNPQDRTIPPTFPIFGNRTGLPATCALNATVTTTIHVDWVGYGPPPPTVKLAISSNAGASRRGDGEVLADNGMGDSPVYTSDGDQVTVTSSGTHYRKYELEGSSVILHNTATANSTATGVIIQASISRSVTAALANWSIDLVSDREPTFHRKFNPATSYGQPIPNRKEAGSYTRGDIVYEPLARLGGPPHPTDVLFTGSLDGPWSSFTQAALHCAPNEGPLSTSPAMPPYLVYQRDDWLDLGPQTMTASFHADDLLNGLSETAYYIMYVHWKAEKEEKIDSWNGILYKHPDPAIRSRYAPKQISNTLYNIGPGEVVVTWECTDEATVTTGWQDTINGQVSLDYAIANAMFGASETVSSSTTYKKGLTYSIRITIPSNNKLIIWAVPTGTVDLWNTSRWNSQGYFADGRELVIPSVHYDFVFQKTPAEDPVTWP